MWRPWERVNDARETKWEPLEGIALDCSSCPADGTGDVNSVGAWCAGYASRCGALDVSRGAPAVTAAAAPAGPRARRTRDRGDRGAVAPARRDRAPGSGQGRAVSPAGRVRVGWGWETNAMRLRVQRILHRPPADFPQREKASGNLGKPLSPACDETQGGSLSLLFRVFASCRRANSWSPACRGAERVASPDLPRVFRYLAPRRRPLVVEFQSPPQDPVRGLPG